jgi:hypothetical protein
MNSALLKTEARSEEDQQAQTEAFARGTAGRARTDPGWQGCGRHGCSKMLLIRAFIIASPEKYVGG